MHVLAVNCGVGGDHIFVSVCVGGGGEGDEQAVLLS